MPPPLLCPSAQPSVPGARLFGVIAGEPGKVDVVYLPTAMPVTEELLASTAPVSPTEVLRVAAPCQGGRCQHYDGHECRLVNNLVQIAPATGELKPCPIRGACRWFAQQGGAACAMCSQVITTYYHPPEDLDRAATPFREQESVP